MDQISIWCKAITSQDKTRINNTRDILVGKVPAPKTQVEQITTALIYKFMYDMDQETVELGGVASFFVEEYAQFDWARGGHGVDDGGDGDVGESVFGVRLVSSQKFGGM